MLATLRLGNDDGIAGVNKEISGDHGDLSHHLATTNGDVFGLRSFEVVLTDVVVLAHSKPSNAICPVGRPPADRGLPYGL